MNQVPDDRLALAKLFQEVVEPAEGAAAARILDFGCGAGQLVDQMHRLGVEAYGCDVDFYWTVGLADDLSVPRDRFATIPSDPYRLPFPDGFFDAVVSTSVLEHAQNREELLVEIKRILRPGGLSMHVMPAKWYLPTEPHILVPFVSWLWPHVPRWWLALWAHLGVRNEFQQELPAREVVELNEKYVRDGLSYHSTGAWERVSRRVFGNVEWPMALLLSHVDGGVARLWRSFPFKRAIEILSRETRMAFMVHRKTS